MTMKHETNTREVRHEEEGKGRFRVHPGGTASMTDSDPRNAFLPEQALEDASDWLLRLEDAPDDVGLRSGLEEWLAASPENARAWALAHRAVGMSRRAAPVLLREEDSPVVGPVVTPVVAPPPAAAYAGREKAGHGPARRGIRRGFPLWRPMRRYALPAVAAALILAFLMPEMAIRLRADHISTIGEMRPVSLADGSAIMLGADSALTARLGADRREVRLLRGEAWFDVARDESRPFTVHADDMAVTVTGTAFDVAMTEGVMSVGLADGSVRVTRPGLPGLKLALQPGQRLVIDRATGVAALRAVDVQEIGAWRSGRLVAHDSSLADVAAALDRYYHGMIIVRGDMLKSARVTGVYDLMDTEGSLRTLASHSGAHVRYITPWLMVIS